jgi:hypothetical protein
MFENRNTPAGAGRRFIDAPEAKRQLGSTIVRLQADRVPILTPRDAEHLREWAESMPGTAAGAAEITRLNHALSYFERMSADDARSALAAGMGIFRETPARSKVVELERLVMEIERDRWEMKAREES